MIAGALSDFATVVSGRIVGPAARFQGLCIDSRALRPGELFVALAGAHGHGHDFLAHAHERQAAAAVVEAVQPVDLPQLVVADARAALGALGRAWRARFSLPVAAVTGSNGKTTVKEMIAAIAAVRAEVLATQGNLNNELGVPLTLARLHPRHWAAVVEMGANHAGEIAYLTRLAMPSVGIVTNAGAAHLAGFGSLEGVAKAKGELFAGLPASGLAVINLDDPQAGRWRAMTRARVTTFGFGEGADWRVDPASVTLSGESAEVATQFELSSPLGRAAIRIGFLGRHNVLNAAAAAAAAAGLGCTLDEITQGLGKASAIAGRLRPRRLAAAEGWLIDDSYNANPSSLQAALDVLAALDGERWLVLGDMGELGETGRARHAAAGREARAWGVHRLYTVGDLSAAAAASFGEVGRHFNDVNALASRVIDDLGGALRPVAVLVKGSRRMGMERVVAALAAAGQVGAGG